jgi:hypothetical protein
MFAGRIAHCLFLGAKPAFTGNISVVEVKARIRGPPWKNGTSGDDDRVPLSQVGSGCPCGTRHGVAS